MTDYKHTKYLTNVFTKDAVVNKYSVGEYFLMIIG